MVLATGGELATVAAPALSPPLSSIRSRAVSHLIRVGKVTLFREEVCTQFVNERKEGGGKNGKVLITAIQCITTEM